MVMKYIRTVETDLKYPNQSNSPHCRQKSMDYNKETKVWTIEQYNWPVKGSNVCTMTVYEDSLDS